MRTPPGAGPADARHRPRASAAAAPGTAASGAAALTDAERTLLRDESLSWAAQHGLLVATEGAPSGATMAATFTHAPVSLLPTPFPRGAFELAEEVSPLFAELSDLVSRDHAFLEATLAGVLETDAFTRALWDVYVASGGQAGRHECEVGVLRSDYMLDAPSGAPLQVEVNTVSTSFMALGTRVQQMHRHVSGYFPDLDASATPADDALSAAAATLAAGHAAAGDANARLLMVVQPGETNVFDQRLLADALWYEHGVRVTRATLAEIADEARVTTEDDASRFVSFRGEAHSLVYFRAGYAPADYPSDKEWAARLLLEKSGAVKSPSVAMQLAGTKKVQQALAEPGALERFAGAFVSVSGADDAEAHARARDAACAKMRSVFAGLYALDDAGAAAAVSLALADPGGFVLKPQREGGGNNLYGDEMVAVLRTHDPTARRGAKGDLSAFILMQRIFPPRRRALCLRKGELVELETVSELGIYGGYVRVGDVITRNARGGHLLRTKAATSDEGGVAAGFAVLDAVALE